VDLNCLRIVDCITGMNKRSKFLRSQVALQLLKISFGLKVSMGMPACVVFKKCASLCPFWLGWWRDCLCCMFVI
jgi:hypothetical protein